MNDIYITVSDFNHTLTMLLTVFELTGLCVSPSRESFVFDINTANRSELFYMKLRALISTNDHFLFPLGYKLL